jgi:hypothetical protein
MTFGALGLAVRAPFVLPSGRGEAPEGCMRTMLSVLTVVAVVACSDSFTPTIDNVAGDYSLERLTVIENSSTTDWVAAGATLTISLDTNGTTTGHLFVPGGAAGGGDFDADLAGTWTLTDGIVEFNQTADSFVRDMAFSARENRLAGDETFSGTRVIAVLTK